MANEFVRETCMLIRHDGQAIRQDGVGRLLKRAAGIGIPFYLMGTKHGRRNVGKAWKKAKEITGFGEGEKKPDPGSVTKDSYYNDYIDVPHYYSDSDLDDIRLDKNDLARLLLTSSLLGLAGAGAKQAVTKKGRRQAQAAFIRARSRGARRIREVTGFGEKSHKERQEQTRQAAQESSQRRARAANWSPLKSIGHSLGIVKGPRPTHKEIKSAREEQSAISRMPRER